MRPIKELARMHVDGSLGTLIRGTPMEQCAVNGHQQQRSNVEQCVSISSFLGSVHDMTCVSSHEQATSYKTVSEKHFSYRSLVDIFWKIDLNIQ